MLSQNLLSGTLPSSIGDAANLQQISAHTNELDGTLPASFARLMGLECVPLSTGAVLNQSAVSAVLVALNVLSTAVCPVPVPVARSLDLHRNSLAGTIPMLLSYLSTLTYV
jgi:hypothetical protein